jgi:hypothetical protein
MTERDDLPDERILDVQRRIDLALREPIAEAGASRFSSYVPGSSTAVQTTLLEAGARAGDPLDAIEAILDAFERLVRRLDAGRLRHALMVVLTHHPAVAALGLRLPSLEERSPWKTLPGRRPGS